MTIFNGGLVVFFNLQLVDDALNLARASKLDYETAFGVVLTMEHETEYAVWKAFIRNMNFLRKRLEALVEEDEGLDQDIYLVCKACSNTLESLIFLILCHLQSNPWL